jgi:5-methylcytosine-specific restriction protein A
MPKRPGKACRKFGCAALSYGDRGFCAKHAEEYKQDRLKADREQRETSAQRGYGYRWQQARKGFLAKHPLCVKCLEQGRTTEATVVDHIIPHKGDKVTFWDRDNWQSLCATHHNEKTAREDGAFGRDSKG